MSMSINSFSSEIIGSYKRPVGLLQMFKQCSTTFHLPRHTVITAQSVCVLPLPPPQAAPRPCSDKAEPVFEQPVAGLAGQGEGSVLVVGNTRVAHHPSLLQEVGLLRHAADGVHRCPSTPDNSLLQSLTVTEMRVEE